MKVGIASRPKPGEIQSGDHYLLVEEPERYLVAVADGLGHGPAAAEASKAACSFLALHPAGTPRELIEACSQAIRHTRGAALTVMAFDLSRHQVSYAGVGNVETVSKTVDYVRTVNSPGIVGRNLRTILQTSDRVHPGDIFVLYSDGISSRFRLEDYLALEPQPMADAILANHAKDHDDATCLVLRY